VRTLEVDRDAIHQLHKSGASTRQIAQRLGCARSTVWRVINGHMPRTGSRGTKVDRAVLLDLWQRGLTLIEMGNAIGCSASTVGDLVKQHQMPPREPLKKMPLADPTPDEIAERARECRERHYAMRRAEKEETVRTKVWKWQQQGGAA